MKSSPFAFLSGAVEKLNLFMENRDQREKNMLVGFFFIVLALWATPSAIRSLRALDQPDGSVFRAVLSLIFAGLMLGFAVYSFLRARKISRT